MLIPRLVNVRLVLLGLLPILHWMAPAARAVRPMYHPFALVAGNGVQGYQDGIFYRAEFNVPLGLALDPDGRWLYVSDSRNHRIRKVDLEHKNWVSTLVGGRAGRQDGPLKVATFNDPCALVYLPGEKLAVVDNANGLIRLVDLSSGIVSTLAGGGSNPISNGPASLCDASGVYNLAYVAADQALYFSQPAQGTLKRLDLVDGQMTTVLSKNSDIPHPAALSATVDTLYLADRDSARVFRMDKNGDTRSNPSQVASVETHILALMTTGQRLYALQTGAQYPLVRLLPDFQPVTLTSYWGDTLTDPGRYLPFLRSLNGGWPYAAVADPSQERLFYFAHPDVPIITTFRDLFISNTSAEQTQSTHGVTDLEYPAEKPPRTFRILLVGDSHSGEIHTAPFKTRMADPPSRVTTVYKQLEMELNTQAALDDVPTRFEVLNLYRIAAAPLGVWPTYEVPSACRKNDIDLVLILEMGGYVPTVWYERPLSQDGIPSSDIDTEYSMRPPAERIPDDEDAKKFYEYCKSKNQVRIEGTNLIFNNMDLPDPEARPYLLGLYAKPLEVLKRKLDALQTPSGQKVRLSLIFSPSGQLFPVRTFAEKMWKDVARKLGLGYLDLEGPMTAVGYSYIPMSQLSGDDHFDRNGGIFFGHLLAHQIIKEKMIPWVPQAAPKGEDE